MVTIEQAVTGVLLERGVPTHMSGFRYLQTAIIICYKDCEKLSLITKVLYPEIAKIHKLGDYRRVERCIRGAIGKSKSKDMSNLVFISSAVWHIKQLQEPPT